MRSVLGWFGSGTETSGNPAVMVTTLCQPKYDDIIVIPDASMDTSLTKISHLVLSAPPPTHSRYTLCIPLHTIEHDRWA